MCQPNVTKSRTEKLEANNILHIAYSKTDAVILVLKVLA